MKIKKGFLILLALLLIAGGVYLYLKYKTKKFEDTLVREQVVLSDSKEKENFVKTNNSEKFTVSVGDKIGEMVVIEVGPYNAKFFDVAPENIRMILKGSILVTGLYSYIESEEGFSGYCMSDFDQATRSKLPYVPAYLPLAQEYGKSAKVFCFRNEEFAKEKLGLKTQRITVKIDNYELLSYPAEVIDRVDLIEIISEGTI